MIKWTNHILSWSTFHFPFQVLIHLESNNLSQAFLEAKSIFQIPPNSTTQILAQAKDMSESHVETFLTCQAAQPRHLLGPQLSSPKQPGCFLSSFFSLCSSHLPMRSTPDHAARSLQHLLQSDPPGVLCIGCDFPPWGPSTKFFLYYFFFPHLS